MRVVVTAAASGIGRAIAECFVEAGARVHICDVDAAALEAALADLRDVVGTHADVSDSKQVDRLFAEVIGGIGGIDVLINNAGVAGQRAPIDELDEDQWDHCVSVNLRGPFLTMKRAIPFMKAQRSGCIINISTTSAKTGLPNRTPYVASKAGLLGLSYNAARELGPWNIRCNSVLPGIINNARGQMLLERFASERGLSLEDAEREFLSSVSMRTRIEPREVAEMCLFLAGPGGRHVSGQAIGVCGNMEWEN